MTSDSYVGDDATGRTRILAARCKTCITRTAGERIDLSNERIAEFIRSAVAADSYVVCHATLPGQAPEGVAPAICRGFADAYDTGSLRVIGDLWGFVEITLEDDPS
jgi:hypothetical protein